MAPRWFSSTLSYASPATFPIGGFLFGIANLTDLFYPRFTLWTHMAKSPHMEVLLQGLRQGHPWEVPSAGAGVRLPREATTLVAQYLDAPETNVFFLRLRGGHFHSRNEAFDLVHLNVLVFPMPTPQMSASFNNLLYFGPNPISEEGLEELLEDYNATLARSGLAVHCTIHDRAMIIDTVRVA